MKTTYANISLYDLISTLEKYREILYELFKKEKFPTNIFAASFYDKIQSLQESDIITFFNYGKLDKKVIFECLVLFITPMIHGWEIKRAMVDGGSIVNVCS